MNIFRNLPIRWKIVLIILMTTVLTILLSIGIFIYNDLKFFKSDMSRNLSILASSVGLNSRAALVFLDSERGEDNLSSLEGEDQILFAALYDGNDKVFAKYVRDASNTFRGPMHLKTGQFFYGKHLEIIHPIILKGERVGKIYLHAHFKNYSARLTAYLYIIALILLATLAVAVLVALKLQSIISGPILSLANTAKQISGTSDYSIRVQRENSDELGTLFAGFNEMLSQVEKRESELQIYRNELEDKIVECQVTGEELKENEESTRTILDNAFDAIITMDEGGLVTNWNCRAETIFGWKPHETIGKTLSDLIIPSQLQGIHKEGLEQFLITGQGKVLNQTIETIGIRRDGTEFPVELAISTTKRGQKYIFTGIIRDITLRKRSEKKLINTREQLRNLANRLESVREEEKQRIAREIHDEFGQTLTALKLDLSWVKNNLQPTDGLLIEKVLEMITLTENTIVMVQRIASELRPQMLDILGICEGLRWLAKEFEKRAGISCDLSIEPDKIKLDPERSIAIYRIYQEALTNVARHASALKVQSSLEKKSNQLILKVRDNGNGMDRSKVENPMSLGLIGIRERALVWGGQTQIQTSPGKGTEIIVSIPLDDT